MYLFFKVTIPLWFNLLKNFNIGPIFWRISGRVFIHVFHMCAPMEFDLPKAMELYMIFQPLGDIIISQNSFCLIDWLT